ncbi:restriction endonuclease subunit S [Vibrio parahaemolyticus]|nr:restriction endonuclease subunit S [Vibrio parahaemolyticus]
MSSELRPLLRFSVDSEQWNVKTFKELYAFHPTNSLSRDSLNYEHGQVKNIHYGDIHTKFASIFDITNECVPYVDPDIELLRFKPNSYCKTGDLVVADASEDYKDIGKTIEITNLNEEKVLAGLHTFLARPINDELELGFAAYLMQSWYVRKQVMTIAQGTKVLGISTSRLGNVELPIPHRDVQRKLSDFFNSVDTKIRQLTEKHRLLKEYKKGLIQQIFSQKIRFRDDDGEAFPKWTENRLDYFIERVSNPVDLVTGVEYREIGIRSHGKGIFHKNPVTSSDIGNKRVFWVKEKALVLNIVFAWERAVAVTSDSESGFIASHRFPMYLPKENRADVNYLLYFLLSPKGTRLLNIASPGGAGRNKTLGQSEFAKLKVCLPSIKEQQKITQFLQAIDSKIEGVGTQLEQIKQFKKGLLQQMFV